MQPTRRHLLITACLFLLTGIAQAQRMPQDSWCFSHKWGSSGTEDGQFNYPQGIVVSPDGLVFVADPSNNRIQVFNQDGTFVRKWMVFSPRGVAITQDGLVAVSSSSSVSIFDTDGTLVRTWGSSGSGDGQFSAALGIAVSPEGLVFVVDAGNSRVQVFNQDGNFICKWGTYGTLDGQFSSPNGIAFGTNGRVFVADQSNSRIQVFDQNGNFEHKWSVTSPRGVSVTQDGLVAVCHYSSGSWIRIFEPDGTLIRVWAANYEGIATTTNGLIFATGYSSVEVFSPAGYRVFSRFGNSSLPQVVQTAQRPGTPYLDVDYVVWDGDNTNVTVAAAAFKDGVNSLNNFIGVRSFVDGSESAIGSNVLANVTNRFTWNVAADWQADYVNLKVRMMAQDERGLMSVGFVTLPENLTNALPALTISQSPITHSDMLPLWYWLLATGGEAIELTSGAVYGVGGSYDGVMLAQGITTTAAGRTFLFDRMGVREATVAELNRAKTGPAGVVNQWTPRITVGPNDRPKLVNEYGFDTGDWGADGWWVVKE